jgi:phosphatidylserine decarboxylase
MREGLPLVATAALAAAPAMARSRPVGTALLALAASLAWFFRDPPRTCPGDPELLYAPADGVVTAIEEIDWSWFIQGRALRVVTFLSIFDVHVIRSPATARLVAYERLAGGFAPAFLAGHSERNARQLLALVRTAGDTRGAGEGHTPGDAEGAGEAGKHQGRPAPGTRPEEQPDYASGPLPGPIVQLPAPEHRIVVAQVAGLLARRIVSWRWPGDRLAAGEKLGMIKLGSRADLLVPAGVAVPLVCTGARVRAGLTPLLRYEC